MNSNHRTLVVGASTKEQRTSHQAALRLMEKGYDVVLLGRSDGKIGDQTILTGEPSLENIHTITLYLTQDNQKPLYDYFLSLNPKRIIFNPGAENPELYNLARSKGIEVENACTLVMLSLGNYTN